MTESDSTEEKLVVKFAAGTVNESEQYTVFETTARPDVTEVRLYEETVDHVKSEHGAQFPVDFPSIIEAVGNAVQDPTHTVDSYNNSVEFVDGNTMNKQGHPLRVFVKRHQETTSTYVKTFFFAGAEDDDG